MEVGQTEKKSKKKHTHTYTHTKKICKDWSVMVNQENAYALISEYIELGWLHPNSLTKKYGTVL